MQIFYLHSPFPPNKHVSGFLTSRLMSKSTTENAYPKIDGYVPLQSAFTEDVPQNKNSIRCLVFDIGGK